MIEYETESEHILVLLEESTDYGGRVELSLSF